jgi:demethoxyubiquinone hydroxylase (CLK1/Coq7/Cat5 family)
VAAPSAARAGKPGGSIGNPLKSRPLTSTLAIQSPARTYQARCVQLAPATIRSVGRQSFFKNRTRELLSGLGEPHPVTSQETRALSPRCLITPALLTTLASLLNLNMFNRGLIGTVGSCLSAGAAFTDLELIRGRLMETQHIRTCLISILKRAYSGEMAAAYAYRGHWKSLSNPDEINGIKRIEDEEWIHRATVGRMLRGFGSAPAQITEARCWIVGRAIALACHLCGWFLPMFFAGKLESENTKEYETAAFYARELGLIEFYEELMVMSAVEKEHELFFLAAVSGHRLLPLVSKIFNWGEHGSEATVSGPSASEPRCAIRETVNSGRNSQDRVL